MPDWRVEKFYTLTFVIDAETREDVEKVCKRIEQTFQSIPLCDPNCSMRNFSISHTEENSGFDLDCIATQTWPIERVDAAGIVIDDDAE